MKYNKHTNFNLPEFWQFAYTEGKHYFFQKYSWLTLPAGGKYSLVKCTEKDIDNGNLLYFIEHGFTR